MGKPKSWTQEYWRQYQRNWYATHRKQESERKKKFYRENPQLVLERVTSWRQRNPEHYQALIKRNNGDRHYKSAAKCKRRARQHNASGCHSSTQWLARVGYHEWKCYYCKAELNDATLTKDHRIPLVRGGTNWPANLVPACMRCNVRKHTRTESEFAHAL